VKMRRKKRGGTLVIARRPACNWTPDDKANSLRGVHRVDRSRDPNVHSSSVPGGTDSALTESSESLSRSRQRG